MACQSRHQPPRIPHHWQGWCRSPHRQNPPWPRNQNRRRIQNPTLQSRPHRALGACLSSSSPSCLLPACQGQIRSHLMPAPALQGSMKISHRATLCVVSLGLVKCHEMRRGHCPSLQTPAVPNWARGSSKPQLALRLYLAARSQLQPSRGSRGSSRWSAAPAATPLALAHVSYTCAPNALQQSTPRKTNDHLRLGPTTPRSAEESACPTWTSA
mmetsp:Transcript_87664/g.200315  ORF Transcript_87664/g.200315 Transcript_87664/m.200315 type:complete len:213 (-) Transcript_87664:651-1289(-)